MLDYISIPVAVIVGMLAGFPLWILFMTCQITAKRSPSIIDGTCQRGEGKVINARIME